jgi:hypothetical protein
MTNTDIAPANPATSIERVLIQGDLSHLKPEEKVSYYLKVCETLGLNPYTKPFEFIALNGRVVLYARKDATDQLRKLHRINIVHLEREQIGELMVVTVQAQAADGRRDVAIGAVTTGGLKGDALANALMRAETKAKRRVTLSICGLGLTDESEVDSDTQRIEMQPPSREEVAAGAQRYDEIFAQEEEPSQRVKALVMENAKLLQTAYELGALGLRQLTAQKEWAVARIIEANQELQERIKSRNSDLDRQAVQQSSQALPL